MADTNTALVETDFGLAHKTASEDGRALCHPTRPMYSDGLCESCLHARETLDKMLEHAEAVRAEEGAANLPAVFDDLKTPKRRALRQSMIELYRNVEFAEGVAEYARALAVHALPRYVELMMKAAEVAAENGDSRPMEFMLKFAKTMEMKQTVVDAPQGTSGPKTGGQTGVKVMIGLSLGNIPANQKVLSAQVVDAEVE